MSWGAQYIGVPYVLNAREESDGGLDCWGLVRRIYKEQRGIDLPDYGLVSAEDTEAVAAALAEGKEAGPWRRVMTPQDFDVAGIYGRVKGARLINHVGVFCGGLVIHANNKTHSVAEPVGSSRMRFRIAGFWRYTDV